jgi:hypothetical protein
MRSLLVFAVLLAFRPNSIFGQTLTRRPEQPTPASAVTSVSQPTPKPTLLWVPTGMALKVVLDQTVRIHRVGQPIHGTIVEPVYAFDQMVVPAGAAIVGEISAIDPVPKKRRILAAMNGEFSPSRQVHIVFNDLVLADGRHVPLKTDVSPGSGRVLQFLPAGETKKQPGKKNEAKNTVSREISEAEKAVKRDWEAAKMQLREPGKMQKVSHFAVAQLPYHPQYIDSGTSFNADLRCPLEFGFRRLTPAVLERIGSPLPAGSVVHAILITPIDSAHSRKGDPVEALITQPLVNSGHLFLPEGSRLSGSVLQVRPAGKLSRNGQLRIAFHQVVPAGGIRQPVEASLEGVAVEKGEHLSLDSEGGAQVTTPKTRYLATAISVALASSSMADHDRDAGIHGADGGDIGKGAANGAAGFRFLGTIIGAFSHSRVVASGFGFYGAAISVYSHFLARGRDVVYPKDMSMTIEVGTTEKQPAAGAQPTTQQRQMRASPSR